MIKDALWQEIDSLPESQLEALLDFVKFLQYQNQQKLKTQKTTSRIPGLDAGTTWVSDDFDDPLPESFWFDES